MIFKYFPTWIILNLDNICIIMTERETYVSTRICIFLSLFLGPHSQVTEKTLMVDVGEKLGLVEKSTGKKPVSFMINYHF